MKRLLCSFFALLALLSLCACAATVGEHEDGLVLYCRTDPGHSRGGDAIAGITVDGDALSAQDKQQQAEYVLHLLLGGCDDPNFKSPVPAGTALQSCTVVGSTAVVDFSAAYGQLSGIDLTIADYCVTLSLTQLPGIYTVRITVNGNELAYRDSNRFMAGDVLLSSTEDVVRTISARLWFYNADGALSPEDRLLTVYEGESRLDVIVDALLAGPETEGWQLLLPEGFSVLTVRADDGVCYLNLPSSDGLLLPADPAAQMSLFRGVVATLCSAEGVSSVQILIDGEMQNTFGAVDISSPLLPTA